MERTTATGTARIAAMSLVAFGLLGAAAVFGPSVGFGFAPIDDGELVLGNLAVRAPLPRAVRAAFTSYDPELYIPVTLLSYRLEYAVHGLAPSGFHAVSVLLHLLSVALLFLLARAVTGRPWVAAAAALLFAVHPVQTEAVVWISARKDLLMTAFALGSLLAYLRSAGRWNGWLALAVLLFALALLSKPSALLLPLALPLLEALPGRPWGRSLVRASPFLALSAIAGVIGIAGKTHLLGRADPLQTVAVALEGVGLTMGKVLFLVAPRIAYDRPEGVSLGDPLAVVSLLLLCGIVALCVTQARRRPAVSAGLALFVLGLLPAVLNSRVGGVPALAADRYAYLPLAGLLLALCGAGEELAGRWEHAGRRAALAAVVVIACIAGWSSRAVTASWRDAPALYGRALAHQPDSSPTRVALSRLLLEEGRTQDAFDLLRDSLAHGDDAVLHVGAGQVYAAAGDPAEARTQFALAAEKDPVSPDPHFARGMLELALGDRAAARRPLEQAVELDPSFAEARVALAALLLAEGQALGAERQLREALRWRPSSGEAHRLLADLLEGRGETAEAAAHREDARSLGAGA